MLVKETVGLATSPPAAQHDLVQSRQPEARSVSQGADSLYSIEAQALPVHARLSQLAEAVAELLLYSKLPSESHVRQRVAAISSTREYGRPIAGPAKLGLAEVPLVRILPPSPERFGDRAWISDAGLIPQLEIGPSETYGGALRRHHAAIGSGFLLLEWDVAIDAFDWCEMMAYIFSEPETVWAAPYYLYYPSETLTAPSQVPDDSITAEDGTVPFVPLGCTYLPGSVLERMWAEGVDLRYPTPDHDFNQWANPAGVRRKLAYYCRPKHLHFGHHVSMRAPA